MTPDGSSFFADSVEGIWQGLKLIDGQSDEALFSGRPTARAGRVTGFQFDYRTLTPREAQALIYIPSYLAQLEREHAAVEQLREEGATQDIEIVDLCHVPDVFAEDAPPCPARLLVDFLQGDLDPYLAAHARARAAGDELLAVHERHGEGDTDALWIDHCAVMHTLADRAITLSRTRSGFNSYESWASRYEQESLMMYVASLAGVADALDAMKEILTKWMAAGLLSLEEARQLSYKAPFTRFIEDWYQPDETA